MLEYINNLLNSGEIPNLFANDERMQIAEKLRPIIEKKIARGVFSGGSGGGDPSEHFMDYFIERTRENLHVILAMSPIGGAIRERIRNFPSLVNCCTIDWFTAWPAEALEAVADRFLQEANLDTEKGSIIKMCKMIHTDVQSLSGVYQEQDKRYNYVTPTSYLELIQTYKDLLRSQRSKVLTAKLGYDKGIEKLLFTANEVHKMQQDLNEKQPILEEMTIQTDMMMEKITKESNEVVEPKKIQIQEEEAIANQQA